MKKMKVAFFNSHVLWPSHYETELEIIQDYIEKGHEVIQLYCESQLPVCDQNPFFVPSVCKTCRRVRKAGKRLISANFKSQKLPEPSSEQKKKVAQIPTCYNSIKELQSVKVENFDLGFSIVSSLISFTRNPRPQLSDFQSAIYAFITSAAGLYYAFCNWLQSNRPDVVFLFNGRLAHTRAIMRACQKEGVRFVIHERGANKDKYALFENNSPHDLTFVQSEIIRIWKEADPNIREEEGKRFYELTSNGQEIGWFSFTKDQKNVLPENWNEKQYNVVIFNSSEDEFASLSEEWQNHIYSSQIEGIREIIEDLLPEKDIHLYLRVHPNLKKIDNEEKRLLYTLHSSNLTLIKAESEISSYKLLKESSLVLTFGSTMGIEATYHNKPSILAGKSLYSQLGSTYNASSHNEVVELIKSRPKALDKTGALMYGFYTNTFGKDFRVYKAENLQKGSINGHYINRAKGLKEIYIDWFFKNRVLKFFSERIYSYSKVSRIKKFTSLSRLKI
jgi:hypothetical protein